MQSGYLKIIDVPASKKSGLTRKEIINEAGLEDNGLLTEMLKNLKNSQFIRAYNTFGYDEKNIVYQLADYFTLFYLRFMKGRQNPDAHFWTHSLDNPDKSNCIDRRDRTTNICEIKFSAGEFVIDKDHKEKLRKKVEVFREATQSKKALQLVMITTYGVRQNAHSGIVQSQVCMEDLFAR